MHIFLAILAYCILGLCTGLLNGAFGIGGGIIITPGLILIFKLLSVPEEHLTHMAVGTSLVYILFTSSVTSYSYFKLKYGRVAPKLLLFITALIGGYFGSKVALQSKGETLEILLGIIEVGVGLQIFITGLLRKREKQPVINNRNICKYGWLWFTILGLICGFISPLTGVGGGIIIIPILLLLFKVPYKEAVSYGSFMVIAPSLMGTLYFIINGIEREVEDIHREITPILHHLNIIFPTGLISPMALLFLIPFGYIGATLGVHFIKVNNNEEKLKSLLAIIFIVIGSLILADSIM